jgi:5-(carboxyamino)imidazole ribonucleotide synthase
MDSRPAQGAASPVAPVSPGAWLGVLGGGQLGRMFAHAAQSLGYRVCVLDPVEEGPAGAVADRQIVAGYEDARALDELGSLCAAVTTEFENVPAASLERLARAIPVRPAAAAVAVAQDRLREKSFLRGCGVEVAPHAPVVSEETLASAAGGGLFPGILKTARLGYDGKGQIAVDGAAALARAWRELQRAPCVLEKRLALRRELSVIIARGADGAAASFPVCENVHRNGILARTWLPARVTPSCAQDARRIAERVADALGYVGVLCLELFELEDGSLVANEMAPRPHNSGHATIEACACSQFDQQARALAGLPLAEPRLLAPAVMINLLGDLWFDGTDAPRAPAWERVLAVAGTRLHLYGKAEPRRGRKMGHLTVLGESMEQADARADEAARILGLAPPPRGAPAA